MAAKALDFILRVQGSERLTAALREVRNMFANVAEAEDGATLSARDLNVAFTELKRAYMEVAGAGGKAVDATKQDSEAKKLAAAFEKEYASAVGMSTKELRAQTLAATENAKAFMSARNASEAQRLSMGRSFNTVNSIAKSGNPAFMKIAGWAGVDAVGLAYESVKKYMSYSSKLTQSITQAGVPLKDMSGISSGILDISRQTGQSANDLADAFYRVASATAGSKTSVKDMLTYTKAIAEFNILGNIPQGVQSEQSARVVMAAVNAQLRGTRGHGKEGVNKVIASLNAIIGTGDIRASDLLAGFGRGYLAVGKANNLSMADMGSALDTLTQLGTGGAAAGTMAQRAMQMMFSPTTQGAKGLAMVGLKYDSLRKAEAKGGLPAALKLLSDSLKQFKVFSYPKYKGASGRQGAINQLEEWFQGQLPQKFIDKWSKGMASKGGLSQADQRQIMTMLLNKMFGGARSSATMMNLLFDLPRLTANYKHIQADSTQAYLKKQEAIANASPAVQFRKAVANINADLIELGKTLTPVAVELAKEFSGIINAIIKFKPLLYTIMAVVAGLATAYVGIKAARLARGVGAMFGGIGRGLESASLFARGVRGDARIAALNESDVYGKGIGRRQWAMKNANRVSSDTQLREAMAAVGSNRTALEENTAALKMGGRGGKGGRGASSGFSSSIESKASSVVSEGESAVSAGSGMLGRAGGLLGGALDMLGGPMGMAMMALPFALPLISSGISALFGGSSAPRVAMYTPLGVVDYHRKKNALTSKQKNLGKNLGSGKAQDYINYLSTVGAISNLNTKFGQKSQEDEFLKGFNSMLKHSKQKGYLIHGRYGPSEIIGNLTAAGKKQRNDLIKFMKANPEIAAYMSKSSATALQYRELMGTTNADITSKNSKIRQLAIKNNEKEAERYFKGINNRKMKGGALSRYALAGVGIQELGQKIKLEQSMEKQKGLTATDKKRLEVGITALQKDITKMQKDATKIKTNNKLDDASIKTLALEIANQNKAVYTSLGIGKDAFVAGVIAAAPAIAAGIKSSNASTGSHQAPGLIAHNGG
jgi:hypothetical protein